MLLNACRPTPCLIDGVEGDEYNSQIRLDRKNKRPPKFTIHHSRPLRPFLCEIAPKECSSKNLACDILANLKIRLDSVKRMTQIQNTSQSIAATKYFRIAAREHPLAPPGRHRPRHSRMSLPARQNTPALDAAIYYPNSTLYQLQPSFHT